MTRPFRSFAFLATVAALTLSACSREAEAPTANDMAMDNAVTDNAAPDNAAMADGNAMGPAQTFSFKGGDGAALGSVLVRDVEGGVVLAFSATGMPAGTHGIHLHEKGLCEGPKFESAGAHWNPAGKQHGRDNPQGPHLGDLPNLEVRADGSGAASLTVAGAMMASGSAMIADADGTSVVVHAKPDDYRTDPSGNSGDRIACAVLAPPK